MSLVQIDHYHEGAGELPSGSPGLLTETVSPQQRFRPGILVGEDEEVNRLDEARQLFEALVASLEQDGVDTGMTSDTTPPSRPSLSSTPPEAVTWPVCHLRGIMRLREAEQVEDERAEFARMVQEERRREAEAFLGVLSSWGFFADSGQSRRVHSTAA